LPYADVLAWCLMPNHFHIMVYVNEVELVLPTQGLTRNKAANSLIPLVGICKKWFLY